MFNITFYEFMANFKNYNNIKWNHVQEDYENHMRMSDLEAKYKITFRSILARAAKGKWVRKGEEEMKKEKIIHHELLNRKHHERVKREIDDIKRDLDEVRDSHRILARSSLQQIQDLSTELRNDSAVDKQYKIDAMKRLAESAKIWIATERELYGITAGTEVNETDLLIQMTDDPIKASEAYKKLMG